MEIQFREMERRLAASNLLTREIAKRALSRPGLALATSSLQWKAMESNGKQWKAMESNGNEMERNGKDIQTKEPFGIESK